MKVTCARCLKPYEWTGTIPAPEEYYLAHGCGDRQSATEFSAPKEVGMTRLEKAVRGMYKDTRAIQHVRDNPGMYTKDISELIAAIDELDRERAATTKIMGCDECSNPRICCSDGPDTPTWCKTHCPEHRPMQRNAAAALTDTQRRMGLRSARFVGGPEWNSDVD